MTTLARSVTNLGQLSGFKIKSVQDPIAESNEAIRRTIIQFIASIQEERDQPER